MPRLHGHVICDTPGCGATTPEDSPRLATWRVLSSEHAPDAYLCERCVEAQEHGALAEPLSLYCVRCGRKPSEDVKHWWGVRDENGRIVNVCGDCKRPDDRTDVL